MTRLEEILEEQLAPIANAIDNAVRVQALSSALDDLFIKVAGFEVENHRMREAMEEALAAIVAGDTRAAGNVLKGALR